MEMFQILKKLDNYATHMDFNDGATKRELEEFQSINGIRLPEPYIDLLSRFDGGELFVPGTVIYGVKHLFANSTVKEVNSKKSRQFFNIPNTLMIIGKLNYGDLICLDLNDGKVIQWDHENDVEFCRWESLEEWLDEEISAYEKYESSDQS